MGDVKKDLNPSHKQRFAVLDGKRLILVFLRAWMNFGGTDQIFLLCKRVFGGDRRT